MEKLENLYNVAQVAEKLGIAKKTVRDLINDGSITAYKVGREWRISEQNILNYLNQNKNRKEEN